MSLGDEFIKLANKKHYRFLCCKSNDNIQIDLYLKAADQYYLEKEYQKASETYLKLIDITRLKVDFTTILKYYNKAVKLRRMANMGFQDIITILRYEADDAFKISDLDKCGLIYEALAELYDNQIALEYYCLALDCATNNSATNSSYKVYHLRSCIAELCSKMGSYLTGIQMYNAIADMESDLTSKTQAVVKSILCQLALCLQVPYKSINDVYIYKNYYENILKTDLQTWLFINKIIKVVEEIDEAGFLEVLYRIHTFDLVYYQLMLQIKKELHIVSSMRDTTKNENAQQARGTNDGNE